MIRTPHTCGPLPPAEDHPSGTLVRCPACNRPFLSRPYTGICAGRPIPAADTPVNRVWVRLPRRSWIWRDNFQIPTQIS